MRRVAILAAVFTMVSFFAINSPSAHAAPISKDKRSNMKTASVSNTKFTVIVQSGDTLSQLAEKYDTTVKRIFYANTNIANPNLIFPGQRLVIPNDTETLTPRPMPGDVPSKPAVVNPAPVQSPSTTSTSATTKSVSTPPPESSASTTVAAPPSTSADQSVWDKLAMCESSGNWSVDTGNGFYGGLQFTLQSWEAVGGTGYPNDASQSEQIAMAEKLQALQGWGAWPVCSTELGL